MDRQIPCRRGSEMPLNDILELMDVAGGGLCK